MLRALSVRFERRPIETVEDLIEFDRTRSAYIAQTALYGYLRTRMGIRYPVIFQDDYFAPSINRAKARTFAACLSDLSVFAAALIGAQTRSSPDDTAGLAQICFAESLRRAATEAALDIDVDILISGFAERCANMAWPAAAIGENAFRISPAELIAAAPVAEELKRHDVEIVTNSIRFRWRDVREQLRRRLDAGAVARNFAAGRDRWTSPGR